MSYNSKYTGEQVEFLLEKAGTAIQEHQDISGKQDVINDLAAIRNGASKGATALQSVPSEYVTETELTNKGYATTSSVNTALGGKVDKVSGKQLSTEDFTTLLKQKLEGLSNYDDKEIQEAVSKLRTDLDTLVSGDTTSAIKTFNEIIAFLDGISDTEDLVGIIASIEQQIAAKYTKPSGGIPKSDLASAVQTSLGKADTALQSYTETDPTVPSWAKAASKPTYTASEVGAVPTTRKVNGKALSTDITLSASDVSALPNTTVIPTKVSQLTNDSNFTSNPGTITGITMNGASKGTSGVVNLGTVITAHQDISGKQDKLVSGTNIKTVNGQSLLGSGDLAIAGNGNWSGYPVVYVDSLSAYIDMKPYTIYYLNDSAATGVTITSLIGDTADSCNEYILIFKDTSDIKSQPFTLTLPSNIKFSGHKVTPYFGVLNILHIRNGFAYLDYRMEIPSSTYEYTVDYQDIFNIYKYFLAEGQKTGAMCGFFEPSRFEKFFHSSSVNKYAILFDEYYEYYVVCFLNADTSWSQFNSIYVDDLRGNCEAWVRFDPEHIYFTENRGFNLS